MATGQSSRRPRPPYFLPRKPRFVASPLCAPGPGDDDAGTYQGGPAMKSAKECLFLIAIIVVTLAVTGCAGATELQKGHGEQMKAIVSTEFGTPDVLRLEEIDRPVIKEDNQVLVKVHAAAINPLDWHEIRGTPYVGRLTGMGCSSPKNAKHGVDFAGEVI